MAHTITGGQTFDTMAPKMLGHVVIPTDAYSADGGFQSIQALVQALIDQAATARTLTAGGTMGITNYKSNGPSVISVLEANVTEIPINGDVGGIIETLDENNVPIQLRWNVTYLDQPEIG